jgi:hypothetical protein
MYREPFKARGAVTAECNMDLIAFEILADLGFTA